MIDPDQRGADSAGRIRFGIGLQIFAACVLAYVTVRTLVDVIDGSVSVGIGAFGLFLLVMAASFVGLLIHAKLRRLREVLADVSRRP